MTQRKQLTAAGVASLALLAALLVLLARPARAQDGKPLLPGVAAQGELTSALGDQWDLYGCAGDVVTVTLASTEFTPYLAVFTDTVEAPIVEAVAEDGEPAAVVIEVDATGLYAVIAAGDRRSARGVYTITAQSGTAQRGDLLPDAVEAGTAALGYGATITGVVQTSAGERLFFHGCAGDAVTVAANSEEFTPFIELFDPAAEETVAESEATSDAEAVIAGATLSTTGTYELFVAGQRRSDRGPFTLTLSLATTNTLAPPSAARTPVAASPTPTSAPSCIILASPLNLRAGPGTNFAPPIGALRFNSTVLLLARNEDASWIEVETSPAGLRGWVSAGAQFVRCTVEPASLPLGELPPTPTPRPTSTPIPTAAPTPTLPPVVVIPNLEPSPTLPPLVVLPGGGPGGGGWEGAIVTGFGIGTISGGNAVFRDRVFFRAEISRTPNNRKIDQVDFVITDENGDEVYRRTERVYGYCAFGGGEPACNLLEIGRDARWPDTDNRIRNGDYNVEARIFLEGDNDPSARWNTPFTIDNPALDGNVAAPGQQDLVVRIVQTAPNSDADIAYGALVFQVEAYDPGRGSRDGDGIRNVDLRIFDENGSRVYERTENNVAYCAFAGGEPVCNIFDFAENGDAWPGGEPIRFGRRYTLRGTANAEDGRSRTVEMTVTLER